MRILITSNSHPNYDQVGHIQESPKPGVFIITLEKTGERVAVQEGQFKFIR